MFDFRFSDSKSSVLFNSTQLQRTFMECIFPHTTLFLQVLRVCALWNASWQALSITCALHFQGRYKNISDRADLYKKPVFPQLDTFSTLLTDNSSSSTSFITIFKNGQRQYLTDKNTGQISLSAFKVFYNLIPSYLINFPELTEKSQINLFLLQIHFLYIFLPSLLSIPSSKPRSDAQYSSSTPDRVPSL